jgi:hypothetical protein
VIGPDNIRVPRGRYASVAYPWYGALWVVGDALGKAEILSGGLRNDPGG